MDTNRESAPPAASLQADLFGSSAHPAQIVALQCVGERLLVQGAGFTQSVPLHQIHWPVLDDSPPKGPAGCLLELPDGALLHCRPDPLLVQWRAAAHQRPPWRGRPWRQMLLAGLAAGLVWAGLPAAAESLLPQVPGQIDRHIGQRLLDRLDTLWLRPSALPAQEQQVWRQRLTEAVGQVCPDARLPAWNLQFRRGRADEGHGQTGAIGLPGGTVVLLDEQLGRGTLDALCGELSQLQQRQGMRTLARQQPVSLLLGVAFDDFSSTVAVAWPVLLPHLPFGSLPAPHRIARR